MAASSNTVPSTRGTKRNHEMMIDKDDMHLDLVKPTETNVLGLPDAPPYHIVLVKNQTLDDTVLTDDLDYVRKLSHFAWLYYNGGRTASMWITRDKTDEVYEISWCFPDGTEVPHDLHNALYRIYPRRVTKRSFTTPWLDSAGELWTLLTIRVATHLRTRLPVRRTIMFLCEEEEDEPMVILDDHAAKRFRSDNGNGAH
jgi:hypothetical protein